MEQKNSFQTMLTTPWGVLGFMVIVGSGLSFLALLVLVLFGVNLTV